MTERLCEIFASAPNESALKFVIGALGAAVIQDHVAVSGLLLSVAS